MKTKKPIYPAAGNIPPMALRDVAMPAELRQEAAAPEAAMVRTQIYLSRTEHAFVQAEATRQGVPMAAVIRSFIDARMALPEAAWDDNALLAPPADPSFEGPEDGILNHDHYVYGTPKRWIKQRGRWVKAPPLPDDYHTSEASRRAHDRKTREPA